VENENPQTDVIATLVEQEGLEHIDLSQVGAIAPEILSTIPHEIAIKYKVIPFSREKDTVLLTMANPFDIFAEEAIRAATHSHLKLHFTPEDQIDEWLEKLYLQNYIPDYDESLEENHEQDGLNANVLNIDVLEEESDDAPAIKYVNKILANAIQERASDIHIEPQEKSLTVRFRIDGVLRDVATAPKQFQPGIIARIKILSSLDIAERRLPQDGRSKIKIFGRDIDLRVSTLPAIFGEKVVLRILDKDLHSLNIADLGLEPDLQEKFKRDLKRPNGLILVTGPTGSGKTTSLYSALNYVNVRDKNIITIEDPIEYQLKGINQVQAKPEIDFTFSVGLRAILRQDPDIIMVGEIRDLETAQIAMRASLTGHLVFSTLHTNDSVRTIMRLIDMGIDRYLICGSLRLVLAQRLVRRICFHCSESYKINPAILKGFVEDPDYYKNYEFRRSKGCLHCGDTGYWGRVAVFEFFSLDNTIRSMISDGATNDMIKAKAENRGMETLFKNGLKKVIAGVTTIDEIMPLATDFL